MNGNIAVIYEEGVLKPLEPLDLPEKSHLEIKIVSPSPIELLQKNEAYIALLEAGVISPPSQETYPEPVSDSERKRVADEIGKYGPLSELIIQERNEA
jgi:predicted DNA-binding antitoxin AbrB/MazE fold protein